MTVALPIRNPCPPGTCICGRDALLDAPTADLRSLRLTLMEEKRLLERLENIQSLQDLEHMQRRLFDQLGIRLEIAPKASEVRSLRGIGIHIPERPGLCRKIRQSIPAAVRKSLEKRPEIVYRLLDAHDLFRDS
ncbi:hypothetical protein [Pseudomonas sp. N040]|uniref:hypothetical protein n=1 Tax=Pseudomonas sp. N040 TaxID=2785325 RepID=UPI0018A2FF4E|nr:hypothetical protein [Pseudomonas sp. N040]MBF7729232.1 hypothetical protein [Pseudomonas sp. N040]MBW7012872.1 hypothetical protein [Pseudomonas sp. N040]